MVLRCRLAGLYYFTRNAFALKGENMKIIIVGCGKVGTALTAQLSREDNLVTVIDTDSIVVRNVSNTYDVMGIVGNGASYQVLQEADIEHADLMIAVTKSDEMNRFAVSSPNRQQTVTPSPEFEIRCIGRRENLFVKSWVCP